MTSPVPPPTPDATAPAAVAKAGWHRLFTPGPRLGWRFQDRARGLRPFPLRPPDPAALAGHRDAAHEASLLRIRRQAKVGGLLGGGAVVLLFCGAVVYSGHPTRAGASIVFALLAAVATAGWLVLCMARQAAVHSARRAVPARVREDLLDWHRQAQAWVTAEHARLDGVDEWLSVPAPPRRLDVYGGALWGWEALLTVYGAGALAAGCRVWVADLSGQGVARELVRLAHRAGYRFDHQWLPRDLARCRLLAGLPVDELVDALVEMMHGRTGPEGREDRSLDTTLLHDICRVLGADVSIGRIVAALRVLSGRLEPSPLLTAEETGKLAEALLGEEEQRDALRALRRMVAVLEPLAELGTWPRSGAPAPQLTCVALRTDGNGVRDDLLRDMVVQALPHIVAVDAPNRPDVLIVAGADELPERHLERLSDLCARHRVPLLLIFRHLRDEALRGLGSGAVAFMRLGQHEEATRAADFVGRHHRMTLTQLTATLGGNETHTVGDNEGATESAGTGTNTSSTRSTNRGTSGNASASGPLDAGWPTSATVGSGWTGGTGTATTRGASETHTVGRSWGTTRSVAEGTNWTLATSASRVYEYALEPTVLQRLPDYLLLLVDHAPHGLSLTPVEINPDIVTLPRVRMDPSPTDARTPAPRTDGPYPSSSVATSPGGGR
ncbi:hypothetical protein ACFHW0_30165 [Micromonospora sp. LOL_025]|uniref:hypothetical protein n=1 Tax=Micromonospora sp. LOL_025 TaxID=3345413 RepID=UPI003A866715